MGMSLSVFLFGTLLGSSVLASPTYAELMAELGRGTLPDRASLNGFWLAECAYDPDILMQRLGSLQPGQREPFGGIIGGQAKSAEGALRFGTYISLYNADRSLRSPTYPDKNLEETRQWFFSDRGRIQSYFDGLFPLLFPAYQTSAALSSLVFYSNQQGLPTVHMVYSASKGSDGSLLLAVYQIYHAEKPESLKPGEMYSSVEYICRATERLEE